MSFGKFGGDLLVGNFAFGDSVINAFNPTTMAFEGSIDVDVGAGNTPGGLWSLVFGGGARPRQSADAISGNRLRSGGSSLAVLRMWIFLVRARINALAAG